MSLIRRTPDVVRTAELHLRRTARAERDRLRAELASYRTPAERAELDAILARQSEEDLALLRALLR